MMSLLRNETNDKGVSQMLSRHLSWDEYFMGIALLSSYRSKDPNTKVGACIVNNKNKIVGIGYNGFPTGCNESELSWAREGDFLKTKYPYVCHAEINAILNSNKMDLDNCRIYVGTFPCNECAKAIIQVGIKEIIFLENKYPKQDIFVASQKLFDMTNVLYRKLEVDIDKIELSYSIFKNNERNS